MKVEYGHAVYCDANDNGTVKGGGEKVGYMGGDAVVVTGGTSPGGGKGDDCGGGRRRWSGGIKEGIKTEYPLLHFTSDRKCNMIMCTNYILDAPDPFF